jgi:protein gp37
VSELQSRRDWQHLPKVTWNPTTGCDRTSPGCDHCYALSLAKRLKALGYPEYQRDGNSRTSGEGFGLTLHEAALQLPMGWSSPSCVLVNSMSDLFHPRVPLSFIQQVFDVMSQTPHHVYQVLTKRSKRLARFAGRLPWPENVGAGVSVETDKYVYRADDLRRVPAAMRFLHLEPLLGPVPSLNLTGIDWVVVGPENGPGSRPMKEEWVIEVRDRCREKGVSFFSAPAARFALLRR